MILQGIVRKLDDLGRIVIPLDYRRQLGLKENQEMEIVIVNDFIVIGKARTEEKVGEG
jgi:transcriptional pleiotropic regulator of transition state genes